MVVDNRWIRIGSSNLSGRSMGLDTECDLQFDAGESRAAILFCAELLAEHLGADTEDVAASLEENGLLATIERFNNGERRLESLHCEPDEWDPWLEPLAKIADLEKPIEKSWVQALSVINDVGTASSGENPADTEPTDEPA